MSTRCEEVSDRLMELLYEELPAGERATLEAHLAGCDRCRADLASFQRTRALARTALDTPPPAGVRQRLVAAAVLEAAARSATAAKETAPAADVRGLWRKLRGRWTLPTLATLGAMAVFLLTSRVFLNQETTVERGRRVTEPQSEPPVPGIAPPPVPGIAPPPVPGIAPPPVAGNASPPVAAPELGRARLAEPPAAGERQKTAEIQERMRERASAAAREESPHRKPSPFPGLADERNQVPGQGGPSFRHRFAVPARGVGATPPVAVGDSPAPAPAQTARAGRPSKESLDDLLDSALTARAKAPAAPAATAGASPAKAEAENAPAPAEQDVVRRAESEVTRKAKRLQPLSESASAARSDSDGAASESVEEIAARAERLFKEERWSDAVALFERLLRQYPKNAQASHWRQRLAAARTAVNATQPSP